MQNVRLEKRKRNKADNSDNNQQDEKNPNQDKPHSSWTPWLLIPYASNDIGLRPLPAEETFWLSPYIWIESSDPLGNAVAGEKNYVHTKIFNLGKATSAPTQVDFYWANPSLGISPATMNYIGTEWVEVEPRTARPVRCSTAWEPFFVNNGHECLIVSCKSPIWESTTQLSQLHFQPQLDRQAGQRNITVIKAKAGEQIDFSLFVNNFYPMTAQGLIVTRIEHLAVVNDAWERLTPSAIINRVAAYGQVFANTPIEMRGRFKEGSAEFRQAAKMAELIASRQPTQDSFVYRVAEQANFARSGACISTKLTEDCCIINPINSRSYLGRLLIATDNLTSSTYALDPNHDIVLHEITMKFSEQRRLELQLGIPFNAQQNEFVVYHLAQIMEESLLGGYTIVVWIEQR
jgi:hypothetical protein